MRELIVFFCLILAGHLAGAQALTGFSKEGADEQRNLEKEFDSRLRASNLDTWMKTLTARPHHLGSVYGKESAEFIRDQFRQWGFEAEIETFHVLFPTPRIRQLEMTAPKRYRAKLREEPLREDASTSAWRDEQLPVYNCWSPDGDVTGDLVFVNYGLPDDYEYLARAGIDVRGKIVIARYGKSWRGIKPKVAQEHGAIGCILYSDPAEDGYFQGDPYPKGAFKNGSAAQRGAVIDLPVAPGDPLTPGYGATPDARRIDRAESNALLRIPVLPVSYGDAQPLLSALSGPVAPPDWRGALPVTYHLGPGPARVHLKLEFDWNMVPCYNVIARMRGAELPDQWVIRGNHHDAWVFGASDPVSGMVALMEEARAVGELAKTGWKPKRTIIYCAWDAEEPGLIGSTEWAEHHAAELKEKAVAYINSDGNSRGFLFAGGSHTLETMMTEIARDVEDPQAGVSVFERSKSQLAVNAPNSKTRSDILERKTLVLAALGSGSDYSPFIQHLGIPSLNVGYGGEGNGGEYHSVYDSYQHYVRFKDPDFKYGIALAKTAGRATLRLANAAQLPFDFTAFHRTVSTYLEEVTGLLDDMRDATEIENRMIAENRFLHAADPQRRLAPPERKEPVPFLDFTPVQNALAALKKVCLYYDDSLSTSRLSPANRAALNKLVCQAEQQLLIEGGLPRRPWYRHAIYAPGYYTGYGVKTLPGIREAIEQRQWMEAGEQIRAAATALAAYTRHLERGRQILEEQ